MFNCLSFDVSYAFPSRTVANFKQCQWSQAKNRTIRRIIFLNVNALEKVNKRRIGTLEEVLYFRGGGKKASVEKTLIF